MRIRYIWYEPSDAQVIVFFGTIISSILFIAIAASVSREGNPLLVFDYGCATTQDYYASIFLCLSLICLAAALFLLPLTFDIKLAGLFSWGAALYCIMLAFVAFEPSSGDLKEESAISAFKAVAYNDVASLSDLLNKKPEIIQQIGYKNNTLLHQAVSRQKPKIVSLLIEAGFDVNAHNSKGLRAIDISRAINNSIITKAIENVMYAGFYELDEIEEKPVVIDKLHDVPDWIREKISDKHIIVSVMVFINAHGDVVDSKMLTPNPLLEDICIKAAATSKYEPGKINKNPVNTKMTLIFDFDGSSYFRGRLEQTSNEAKGGTP